MVMTGLKLLFQRQHLAILMIAMLTVSGCDTRMMVGPPWQQKMLTEGPPGPAMFRQGWQHGCETGIAAVANHLQKFFYNFRQDSKLAREHTYYTGWRIGFDYCQRYVFTYLYTSLIHPPEV